MAKYFLVRRLRSSSPISSSDTSHNFDGRLEIELVVLVLERSAAYRFTALCWLVQIVQSSRNATLLFVAKIRILPFCLHCVTGLVEVPT